MAAAAMLIATAPKAMSQSRTSNTSSRGTTSTTTTGTRTQRTTKTATPKNQTADQTPQTSAGTARTNTHRAQNGTERRSVGRVQTATSPTSKKMRAERIAPTRSYRDMPARGHEVSHGHATRRAEIITHKSDTYYFRDGICYHHCNDRYVVSRPPVGIRVQRLPHYRTIWLNNICYYYYYGTFYRYIDAMSTYEVVVPPVGAIVESIPEGYQQLTIEGQTYYIVDGIQYKPVIYDGEIWYEVIKVS